METKYLFAFTGLKGSGKDTAAEALIEIIDENEHQFIVQFAFADILKNIIHETFGITLAESEIIKRLNIKPFNGLTLREVYQHLGESIKSYFGEDVWAKITIQRLKEVIQDVNVNFLVCTDLRYPIEEACLKKFCEDEGIELIIIKMINTNIKQNTDNHISETLIEDINNNYEIKADNIHQIKLQMEEIYNAISK
jgi:dephospho-CoA kinase